MENLTISESTLNKYFGILENLDTNSKKRLIIKLTKSINSKPKQEQKLENIFGAWQGAKNAEQIISEIKDSRYNNREIEEL
ncbi:MAG TPA: hypothetical protein ENI57_01040 [Ignavibacteria bacterium]|nr:hypothetical protein [Ignavibacteria bacterium]